MTDGSRRNGRRVEWRREQFRSAASVVSALSSFVANGHQTMPSFPPPPLKFRTAGFPQYGFKLAPATATFAPRAYRPPLRLLSKCGVCSVVGLRQTAPRPSDRTTSPVALGSASGYSVRQPHRLLWPHPSLWPGAPAYGLFQRVPQFQSFPNLLRESVGFVSFPVPRRFPRLHLTISSP